jgi:OOP family OmpA-OmpF porin
MTAATAARALALSAALALAVAPVPVATATPSDEPSAAPSDQPSSSDETGSTGSTGSVDPTVFPTTVTSADGVEVTTHGVVQVRPFQETGRAPATLAVHGVHRVDGGTVVYLSVGWTGADAEATPSGLSEIVGTQIGARYRGGGTLTGVRVVDRADGVVLSTLLAPGGDPEAFASEARAFPDEPGVMGVVHAVLPELAPGTTTVDVQTAFGVTVPDVPVTDGLPEPLLPADELVPVGTGWPEVDLADVAAAPEPELSVHELSVVTQSIDEERTTTETAEQVNIDVAADVLFAFDSADLSASARATIAQVGEDVVARASGDTLLVVGHTDSQGSDAYNDDLSRRRAQAVASVLEPYASRAGLRLQVDGRGEREPVADNGSDEGRQANRRVSVTFDVAPQEDQ